MTCLVCRERPARIGSRTGRCAWCISAKKTGKQHEPYRKNACALSVVEKRKCE